MGSTAPDTGPTAIDLAPTIRRLRGEDRRAVLLDTAAALVAEQGTDAVTMDAVAARAGVSRPLVYKHFTNRDELLAAVLRREASEFTATVAAEVERAEGLEGKIRALVRATLDAVGSHSRVYTPLARSGVRDDTFKREQRTYQRRTVQFFARLAVSDLGLTQEQSTAAMAVLLTGLESVWAQWRARPTPGHRTFLENLYVDLVMGGLDRLRNHSD